MAVQPAAASPPQRRRRARSQDPTLTFQQWLQQHERERAKAIQDRKNNARKRKQQANIKQVLLAALLMLLCRMRIGYS